MKELGLFGATIGEEYGGLGLSAWTYAQIVIKVASVWMAPSGIFNSHLIAASAIESNGTEEQKRKYLPQMATGEFRGSLGLTEPNAGSDLQAIRTVAKLDGDHYVVNGSKTWITNSLHGHMTLLLVKTDPRGEAAPQGHEHAHRREGPGLQRRRQAEEDGLPRHRHLPARASTTTACRRRTCSAASKARASSRPPAASSSAGSTSPRAAPASPKARSRWRCATRRSAAPSASRSGSTRRSSSSWPTWRRRSRARRS